MTVTLAAVAHSGTALWYLTRATGLISLILLSATVVLGIVASVGWTSTRWPRFLSQAMHRNLSLFCIALIAIHIVTTVADGYVPITYVDAFIPFLTPYRPLWIGFGALAFDMLLAVGITSGLRRRIGVRAWRGVHYLAYACWPIAVVHGLGSGSDTRLPVMMLIEVVCGAAVVTAVAWRLLAARRSRNSWRMAAAGGTAALVIGIGAFALAGPLQPGWSRRAGTSSAVLAEINARYAATTVGNASGSTVDDGAEHHRSQLDKRASDAPVQRECHRDNHHVGPEQRGRSGGPPFDAASGIEYPTCGKTDRHTRQRRGFDDE